jgi:hypothetical protein
VDRRREDRIRQLCSELLAQADAKKVRELSSNCVRNCAPTLQSYENSSRCTPVFTLIAAVLTPHRTLRLCLTSQKRLRRLR